MIGAFGQVVDIDVGDSIEGPIATGCEQLVVETPSSTTNDTAQLCAAPPAGAGTLSRGVAEVALSKTAPAHVVVQR